MSDAVELHSGVYVARYNRKSLGRVERLAARMTILDEDHVADFGCGNGMLLHVLGKRSGRYVGIDFSPDFIEAADSWAARASLSHYEFHCSSIEDYCEANPDSCDVATALDFSEHIADAEAIAAFASIRKAMRSSARLYIHTPNRRFFMEELKESGVLRQFPEHIAVRTGREMIAILEAAGFALEGIRVDTISHYNVLRILDPLKHLPIVGPHFAARLWIEAQA